MNIALDLGLSIGSMGGGVSPLAASYALRGGGPYYDNPPWGATDWLVWADHIVYNEVQLLALTVGGASPASASDNIACVSLSVGDAWDLAAFTDETFNDGVTVAAIGWGKSAGVLAPALTLYSTTVYAVNPPTTFPFSIVNDNVTFYGFHFRGPNTRLYADVVTRDAAISGAIQVLGDDTTIENCSFYAYHYAGIYLGDGGATTPLRTHVKNCSCWSEITGVGFHYWAWVTGGADYATVSLANATHFEGCVGGARHFVGSAGGANRARWKSTNCIVYGQHEQFLDYHENMWGTHDGHLIFGTSDDAFGGYSVVDTAATISNCDFDHANEAAAIAANGDVNFTLTGNTYAGGERTKLRDAAISLDTQDITAGGSVVLTPSTSGGSAPYTATALYYWVDWGDETAPEYIEDGDTRAHTYSGEGVYLISVIGFQQDGLPTEPVTDTVYVGDGTTYWLCGQVDHSPVTGLVSGDYRYQAKIDGVVVWERDFGLAADTTPSQTVAWPTRRPRFVAIDVSSQITGTGKETVDVQVRVDVISVPAQADLHVHWDNWYIYGGNNADADMSGWTTAATGLTVAHDDYVHSRRYERPCMGMQRFSALTNGDLGSATATVYVAAQPTLTLTPGDTQMTVSWTSMGGDDIVIYYDTDTGTVAGDYASNSVVADPKGTTSKIITGLTNDTAYYFRAVARNTVAGSGHVFTSVISAEVTDTPAASSYADDLVAYSGSVALWPFNETTGSAADNYEGTAARDGTYSNVTLDNVAGPVGAERAGLWVPASSSYADIYSSDLNTNWTPDEITILVWFKVRAAAVWTDSTVRQFLTLRADGSNQFYFQKTGGANTISIRSSGGGTHHTRSIGSVSDTGWICFALTRSISNDRVRVFMDGSKQGADMTGLSAWAGNLANTNTVAGASNTSGGSPMDGHLAYVYIRNGESTEAEVATMSTIS